MKKVTYYIKRLFQMNYMNFFSTIKKIHKRSGKNSIYLFFDIIICSIKYTAGYTDYFLFYFEGLSSKQRATYITRGVNNNYLKTLNDSSYYPYFRNKIKFNKKFKEYLNREYLYLEECTFDDFEKFVKKHKTIMVKPIGLSGGYGVEKLEIKKNSNIKDIYNKLIENKQLLVEQLIIQHKKMSELCPSSVNTLRIVTIRKNGKTTVMLRAIRIGNGINPVDNFHQGGMYSLFDETGKITKPAMDREGKLFEKHPTTNVKIEGFVIPFYKEVVELAIKLSAVIPQVGMTGWDFAITEDGPSLIEGNELPGYDIYQSKIHLNEKKEGLKPLFDKVIYGDVCKK